MKSKIATIRVDFFKVKAEGLHSSLESLIDCVNALPEDESRSLKLGEDSIVRLLKVEKNGDFCRGDIVRIKMDDIPIKASGNSSKTEPVSLQDHEGIGKETAFLYHIPSNILLIQRTYRGVSSQNFVRYFQETTPPQSVLILESIADSDVIKRINNMKQFSNLTIKFAQLDKKDLLANENISVSAALDLSDNYVASNIKIEMSVGRDKSTGLHLKRVKDTFIDLLKRVNNPSQANILKATVVGINSDQEREVIELLKCTMKAEIEITYSGRYISYLNRRNALSDAWVSKKNELGAMFNSIS